MARVKPDEEKAKSVTISMHPAAFEKIEAFIKANHFQRSIFFRLAAENEIMRRKNLLQGLNQATNQNASQATNTSSNYCVDNRPKEVANTIGI